MGAGCYYRTGDNVLAAFWVDINKTIEKSLENSVEMNSDFLYQYLKDELEELNKKYMYYLFYIESTYYGDGYVINVSCNFPIEKTGLFTYNLPYVYRKIAKHLINMGMQLRIATSGYTSTEYDGKSLTLA